MNRKLPLLSRVASIKLAFNPSHPEHISARLFLNVIDTSKLRLEFPTAKILFSADENVKDPDIEISFVNGDCLKLCPSGLTVGDIIERLRWGIRKVINSET
jgi:hypothetical protein